MDEEEAIKYYFSRKYEYQTILDFLEKFHDIKMSKGALLNCLKEYGLKRRGVPVDEEMVRQAIQEELEGSGRLLGYRPIWSNRIPPAVCFALFVLCFELLCLLFLICLLCFGWSELCFGLSVFNVLTVCCEFGCVFCVLECVLCFVRCVLECVLCFVLVGHRTYQDSAFSKIFFSSPSSMPNNFGSTYFRSAQSTTLHAC